MDDLGPTLGRLFEVPASKDHDGNERVCRKQLRLKSETCMVPTSGRIGETRFEISLCI